MTSERRAWSLEAAREMIGEVRDRTRRAVEEVESLVGERDGLVDDPSREAAIDEQVQHVVSLWARSMEALGLDVKGLWLVDFDNGSGYYCWKWPEDGLDHFHGYDEGFAGRIRIQ